MGHSQLPNGNGTNGVSGDSEAAQIDHAIENGTSRKRIVVVGLGMVGIAFMSVKLATRLEHSQSDLRIERNS